MSARLEGGRISSSSVVAGAPKRFSPTILRAKRDIADTEAQVDEGVYESCGIAEDERINTEEA